MDCMEIINWLKDFFYDKSEIDSVLLNKVYPIGSIYLTLDDTVSPEVLFGGEWEKIENRFLFGDGSTYENGELGGEETVTLTANQSGLRAHGHGMAHTHNHRHQVGDKEWSDGTGRESGRVFDSNRKTTYKYTDYNAQASSKSTTDDNTAIPATEGHNNMPPYLVVCMWKRIA